MDYIKYDTEKIKRDITMKQAAIIAGIPVRDDKILCPSHADVLGKLDKKGTNCQLNKNYFYCHACRASGDIFKMIKDYYRNYMDIVISFEKTCEMLVKEMDNPSEYILYDGKTERNGRERKNKEAFLSFPIRDDVLKYMGLKKNVTSTVPDGIVNFKSEIPENKELIKDSAFDSYVYGHTVTSSLVSMFHENPEMFWSMVFPKLMEAKETLWKKKDAFDTKEFTQLYLGICLSLCSYYDYQKDEDAKETLKIEMGKVEMAGIFKLKETPIISGKENPF